MAEKTPMRFPKYFFAFLIVILISGCANQLPPNGGPVDKIPPKIVDVYPPNGTINYKKNYFELTFSEYVQKRTVKSSIFISPKIEGEIQYDWSGKKLKVIFDDSLKLNTTYSISIGTGVKDLNNGNRMANAFNFAFSTGAHIDYGKIIGKVYANNPSGIMIFAYKLNKDSIALNPGIKKPDYISQVGKSGTYELAGLSFTKYRVFAINDRLGNFLYDIGEDQYGAPFSDVTLSKTDSSFSGLNFLMSKEDTTRPHIYYVTMTDKNNLLVKFSEFIDSTRLNKSNFFIFDSTLNKKFTVKYIFKGMARAKQLFLSFNNVIHSNDNVYLISKNIYDDFGNKLNFESTSFVINDKPDTTKPKILKAVVGNNQKKLDPFNPFILISFSEGVDTNLAVSGIHFFNKDTTFLPISIKFIDDASLRLKIKSKLLSNEKYWLRINMSKLIDAAGNKGDSVYSKEFSVENSLNFTGVSGRIIPLIKNYKIVVVLTSAQKQNNRKYLQYADKSYMFNFKRILPGKYLIWSFVDVNNNEKYNFGKVYPYIPSAEFQFYPDTLNLIARWPVGDVKIEFKK